MNNILASSVITGIVCLCCTSGAMKTYAAGAEKKSVPVAPAVPIAEPAPAAAGKLSEPVIGQWGCRAVGPFGVRSIQWQPGMRSITNGVLKVVNNSTARIHAVYTNMVLTGDFAIKTRFKRGSFIGLVKADSSKGLLGLQVMGGVPHTLEIIRKGGEIAMLLDGQPFHYRNYGVKKTDTFMFGVILNKTKACEIYGFECKTGNLPAKKVQAAGNKK